MDAGTEGLLARIAAADFTLCLFFNRAVHRPRVQRFFSTVSRLGDGVFWYTLAIALPPLYGEEALAVSGQMALVGVLGIVIYKLIKAGIIRERPFVTHTVIQLGAKPLDRYSFPSGHTLHAVAFTIVVVAHYPMLGILLIPFTILVGLSRMVLGLHYPSDVLTGAALGTALGWFSFHAVP